MSDLNKIRTKVDKIDTQILTLIKKRLDLVVKIGQIKKANNLNVRDLKREREVMEKITLKAAVIGLSPLFVKKLWQLIFKQSYKIES